MTAPQRPPVVALVGNPNAGKTSLFNALTGARQKVGNYPGVTVERKAGQLLLANGLTAELIDLPGTYGLSATSPDEAVTRDAVLGRLAGERPIDAIIAVVDATNLRNHLRLVLELKALGRPMLVALNMTDLAERDGLEVDVQGLEAELGLKVIATVAVRRRGLERLVGAVSDLVAAPAPAAVGEAVDGDIRALAREARRIAGRHVRSTAAPRRWTDRLDALALHPLFGPLLLGGLLFTIFQSVFAWAEAPMGWIERLIALAQAEVEAGLPDGALRSLLVDGVLAGVGAVLVFLPQILILFFFILLLEQSGYMVRAAFIMDRLMARVGLNGRAFIPLLSSFACAVPGIMATRTIDSARDRLTTILIAPLMTCSARLPVYTVIIGAFIPARTVGGLFNLQGLVLAGLYVAGVAGAMLAALALRRTVTRGAGQSFLLEMPKYQWPGARDLALGLLGRAQAFLVRAGTIILASTIILWALASYPKPPPGFPGTALDHSIAGRIGDALEPLFRPIGFNREIVLALVPAMAAREVAVSALGTVYALDGIDEDNSEGLIKTLRGRWELPTALAFLAWFVFAPQCISTLAVARRETGGWRWPAFMFAYLFAAAWAAAGVTYWAARALLA